MPESESVIEVNGLKVLRVKPAGPVRARPILFIHGMWAGAWFWEDYLRFFASHGYSGYAMDLRGRNGSRPVGSDGQASTDLSSPES